MSSLNIHKFCPHSQDDKILDEYSIELECKSPHKDSTTYYIIQIIHVLSNNTYTFYCCYGGSHSKFTSTIIYEPVLSKDEAIDRFKKKFKDKFGKSYDATDIDINTCYNGGYKLKI